MKSQLKTTKMLWLVIVMIVFGLMVVLSPHRELPESTPVNLAARAPKNVEDGTEVDQDYECAPHLLTEPNAQCQSAKTCEPGGFLNYLEFYYCGSPNIRWLILVAFLLFLLLLFYLLGTVASDFFSPALQEISILLGMSPDLAGITLLAFGNGAPDMFSCFAALADGQGSIAVGGIVGGALFVCFIVVGAIAFTTKCKVNPFSFSRDIICSMVSTLLLAIVVVSGYFRLWIMTLFIILYSIYVILSLVRNYRIQNDKRRVLKFYEALPHVFPTRSERRELEHDYLVDEAHNHKMRRLSYRYSTLFPAMKKESNPSDEEQPKEEEGQATPIDLLADPSEKSSLSSPLMQPQPSSPVLVSSASPSVSPTFSSSSSSSSSPPVPQQILSDEEEDEEEDEDNVEEGQKEEEVESDSVGEENPLLQASKKDPAITSFGENGPSTTEDVADPCCDLALSPHAKNNIDFLSAPFLEPRPITFTPKPSEKRSSDGTPDRLLTLSASFQKLLEHWRQEIDWSGKSLSEKISFVLISPFTFVLTLTIPPVEDQSWDKCVAVMSPIFSPFVIALVFNGYDTYLGGVFPLWVLLFLIGLLLTIPILLFTKLSEKPKRMHFFLLAAFVISILWIYIIATELVSLLQSIGIIANIAPSVLGLTVLAWGNSTGDLIANLAVARQGYPQMALAAAFGNPMFNILLGFGIPMLIYTAILFPVPYPISLNPSLTVSICFVLIGLLTSLFTIPMANFTIPKAYGIYLIFVYILQTVLAVLVEIGVIPF